MVDTEDSKSSAKAWGFKSLRPHQPSLKLRLGRPVIGKTEVTLWWPFFVSGSQHRPASVSMFLPLDCTHHASYDHIMNLNERSIFLFDGVGALVSAVFTGVVLPLLSQWVGLPLWSLYGLAIFPVIYAVYSLSCYWFSKTIKSWMLKTIVMANLFYCVIAGIVIFVFPDITLWGRLFLTAEILIIFGVVAIELKVYRKAFSSPHRTAAPSHRL